MSRTAIHDSAAARALFTPIAALPTEVVAVAYLDRERRLVGMRHSPSPHRDIAELPLREIVADALALDAAALILAHNHPSGDPVASGNDVLATRRLAQALDLLGVTLLDHLILAGPRWTSFRDDHRL